MYLIKTIQYIRNAGYWIGNYQNVTTGNLRGAASKYVLYRGRY